MVEIDYDVSVKMLLTDEDDKHLLQLIIKTLQAEGFNVDGTSYGKEAIEKLNNNSDIMLLLDYKLKDMSSYDVINFINENYNLENYNMRPINVLNE